MFPEDLVELADVRSARLVEVHRLIVIGGAGSRSAIPAGRRSNGDDGLSLEGLIEYAGSVCIVLILQFLGQDQILADRERIVNKV